MPFQHYFPKCPFFFWIVVNSIQIRSNSLQAKFDTGWNSIQLKSNSTLFEFITIQVNNDEFDPKQIINSGSKLLGWTAKFWIHQCG